MALDLGTITSAVVLHDAFSGVFDKIFEAIGTFEEMAKNAFPSASQFAEDMAPAFNVAAIAVGATTAAIVGLVTATSALAERGADVMDVSETLEHFSGSSDVAGANLDALRSGIKGTVDDFTLMKEAGQLLSAGVKLTSEEFGTLGEAAFVLSNRGFGNTEEQLKLVNDAMTTGKTKALAMELGVIDLGDAQKNYADSLGVEVDQLSDAGKAEAARVQTMKILKSAVADAGVQEADFADKVQQARVQFQNWLDNLAVAVTQSPVLTAAVDQLGEAWATAFGGDQTDLIQNIVHWIEQGLIHVVDFGLGVVEAARVAHTAFEAIKVAAEGLASGIGIVVSGIAEVVAGALNLAASIPGATQGMKDAATSATNFRDSVEAMTAGMMDNTREAILSTAGYDDFNQTLDSAGGFLFKMRDAMVDASNKTKDNTKAVDENKDAVGKGTKANQDNTASMIDQTKMQDLQKKGLAEATKLWGEYNQLVASESGTSFDVAEAAIEAWKTDLIAQHKEAHTDTKEFYSAVEAVAKEKLELVGSHWKELADQSRESMQDQAEAARADYERMKQSGLHFSQEVLDAQLKKWMDLKDAADGFGKTGKDAMDKTAEATKKATDQVRTLSGELISMAEAEKRRAQGNSVEVTSQNFGQKLDEITNPWWNPTGQGSNVDKVEAYRLAAQGYSFSEILDIFNKRKTGGGGPTPPPHGPRIPGFAGGGVVMVGERGPELAALPEGTQVFPNGQVPTTGGDGDTFHITMYVNGTGKQVAKEFESVMMNKLRMRRKFGAA